MNNLVNEAELRKPIICNEAEQWVQMLLHRFHKSEETKQYLFLKRGIIQELIDELIPLSKYASRVYADSEVFLKFYPGTTTSFDADFVDKNDKLIERVEVTMAIDGQQKRIQAEALVKYGHTRIHETPKYSGKMRNRIIEEPESHITSSSAIIERQTLLLQEAYLKKHKNLHKYPETTLLIGVDIPLFMDWEYKKIMDGFRIMDKTFKSIKCVNVSSNHYWCLK